MAERAGGAYVELDPKLAPGFANEVGKQLKPAADAVGKSFSATLSKGFRDFGKTAFRAGAQITAGVSLPIALGMKKALDAASDLNEAVNVTGLIFGKARAPIDDFVKSAAKLGFSERSARELTGSIGGLLQNLGLAQDETITWSKRLVTLGADMGSAFNADPAEAVQAIGAALRGETEPIRRFNVVLSDAALKTEAVRLGLAKSTKDVDSAAKARAALSLITKQTAAVQGDFANTSDGVANSNRILKAEMENAAAVIGSQLLPYTTKLLTWAKEAFVWFGKLGEPWKSIILIAGLFLAALGPIVTVVGALATVLGVVLSPVGLIVLAIAGLVAALIYAYTHFEGFRNVVQSVVAWLTGPALAAVKAFVSDAIEVVGQVVDNIAEKWNQLLGWTKSVWPQVSEAIGHVVRVIKEIIGAAIDFIKAAWRAWGDDLMRIAKTSWATIQAVVKAGVDFVRAIIETVVALINGDWGRAWQGIKNALAAVWDGMKAIVSGALSILKSIIGGVLSTIGVLWQGAWDKLKQALPAIWSAIVGAVTTGAAALLSWFASLPGLIFGAIGDLAGKFRTFAGDLISGFVGGLKANAGRIIETIKNTITDKIPGFIKSALGIHSPSKVTFRLGQYVVSGFVDGLKDKKKTVAEAMQEVFGNVSNQLSTLLGSFSVLDQRADARRAVDAARTSLGKLLGEEQALPGQIAAARAILDQARARARRITAQEARDIATAEDAVASATKSYSEAQAALEAARSRKGPTTSELVDFLEAQKTALDAAKDLQDAEKALADAQAGTGTATSDLASLQNDAALKSAKLVQAKEALARADAVAAGKDANLAALARSVYEANLDVTIATENLATTRTESTAATSEVEEAEDKLNDLLDRQKEILPLVEAAQDDLTAAKERAIEAEKAYLDQQAKLQEITPQTIEVFKKLAAAAGLNKDEIEKLIDAYRRLRAGMSNVTPPNLSGGVSPIGGGSGVGLGGPAIDPLTGRPGIWGPGNQPGIGSGQLWSTPGVTGSPSNPLYNGQPLASWTNGNGQKIYYLPDRVPAANDGAMFHAADAGPTYQLQLVGPFGNDQVDIMEQFARMEILGG